LNTHNSTSSACATSQSRAHMGELRWRAPRAQGRAQVEGGRDLRPRRKRPNRVPDLRPWAPRQQEKGSAGREKGRDAAREEPPSGGRRREKGPAAGEESRGGGGREERTCVSRVERGSAAGDRAYLLVTPRAGGEGGGGTGRSPRDDDPRLLPLALSSLSLSRCLARNGIGCNSRTAHGR
jgi:hypothetical protein